MGLAVAAARNVMPLATQFHRLGKAGQKLQRQYAGCQRLDQDRIVLGETRTCPCQHIKRQAVCLARPPLLGPHPPHHGHGMKHAGIIGAPTRLDSCHARGQLRVRILEHLQLEHQLTDHHPRLGGQLGQVNKACVDPTGRLLEHLLCVERSPLGIAGAG